MLAGHSVRAGSDLTCPQLPSPSCHASLHIPQWMACILALPRHSLQRWPRQLLDQLPQFYAASLLFWLIATVISIYVYLLERAERAHVRIAEPQACSQSTSKAAARYDSGDQKGCNGNRLCQQKKQHLTGISVIQIFPASWAAARTNLHSCNGAHTEAWYCALFNWSWIMYRSSLYCVHTLCSGHNQHAESGEACAGGLHGAGQEWVAGDRSNLPCHMMHVCIMHTTHSACTTQFCVASLERGCHL